MDFKSKTVKRNKLSLCNDKRINSTRGNNNYIYAPNLGPPSYAKQM